MKWFLVAALIGFGVVAGCGQEDTSKSGSVAIGDNLDQVDTLDQFEPFDTPPGIMDTTPPAYPDEARKQGLEGTVRVRVVVGADGGVESAEVIESTAGPILEQAALEAARNYRFTPATRDGNPVRCAVALPFQFKLDE